MHLLPFRRGTSRITLTEASDAALEYLTLAVPNAFRVPGDLVKAVTGVIDLFEDEPYIAELTQVRKRKSLQDRADGFIGATSRVLAKLSGLEEETISAHIAVQKDTSIQGAHIEIAKLAYAVPWIRYIGIRLPRHLAEEAAEREGQSACNARGHARELFVLVTERKYKDLHNAIRKGCLKVTGPVQPLPARR